MYTFLARTRFNMSSSFQHLGADITAGGKVVGDCIECPFHKWQFHGKSGYCTAGPASEKVQKFKSTYFDVMF